MQIIAVPRGFDVGTIHLVRKKVGDHDVSILISGPGIDLDKCYYYTSSTSCVIEGGLDAGESRTFTLSTGTTRRAAVL